MLRLVLAHALVFCCLLCYNRRSACHASPSHNRYVCAHAQVISTARTCNLILIVLDCLKPISHKRLIEHELEGFGIRLNKQPPAISFRKKDKGGLNFSTTIQNPKLDLDSALPCFLCTPAIHHLRMRKAALNFWACISCAACTLHALVLSGCALQCACMLAHAATGAGHACTRRQRSVCSEAEGPSRMHACTQQCSRLHALPEERVQRLSEPLKDACMRSPPVVPAHAQPLRACAASTGYTTRTSPCATTATWRT